MSKNEPFYKIPINISKLMRSSKLTSTEYDLYLFIRERDPYFDRPFRIDSAELAEQTGLSRRTIQRSLAKLKEIGVILWQVELQTIGALSSVATNHDAEYLYATNHDAKPGLPVENSHALATNHDALATNHDALATNHDALATASVATKAENAVTATVPKSLRLIQTYKTYKDQDQEKNFENCSQEKNAPVKIATPPKEEIEHKYSTKDLYEKALAKNPETKLPDPMRNQKIAQGGEISAPGHEQELFDCIVLDAKKRGAELRNPAAYVRKCLAEDRAKWESLLAQSKTGPPREHIEEWRVEGAIAQALKYGDVGFARGRIEWLKQNGYGAIAASLTEKFKEALS